MPSPADRWQRHTRTMYLIIPTLREALTARDIRQLSQQALLHQRTHMAVLVVVHTKLITEHGLTDLK